MATNVNDRLTQLRSRRKGTSSAAMEALDEARSVQFSAYATEVEDWEKRGTQSQQWTRYAIGAMQPVGAKYTEVSEQTGLRVAKQLEDRLTKVGIRTEFRLQGSVPLNVHIRGVSDVDVLALTKRLLTYDTNGTKALNGGYGTESSSSSKEVLSKLRQRAEIELEAAFPAAKVDKSGAKAVKVSGGSLPRSVDVVPAHWVDTKEYQASGREAERAVKIYNKKTGETINNSPFLHIERIGARCDGAKGGLRKAIRLCKNVKADSDHDIQLSSFDIGGIMYHADMSALRMGQFTDLAVLAETQRHLDHLWNNKDFAGRLFVPDGSRQIFDAPEKFDWLLRLSLEMDELLDRVYAENATTQPSSGSSRSIRREVVKALAI